MSDRSASADRSAADSSAPAPDPAATLPEPGTLEYAFLAATGSAPPLRDVEPGPQAPAPEAAPETAPPEAVRPETVRPAPSRAGGPVPSNLILKKFVDRLPIPPVLRASRRPSGRGLEIRADVVRTRLHAELPETEIWGWEGSCPGPTIEVDRDQTLEIDWVNSLRDRKGAPAALPYDVVRVPQRSEPGLPFNGDLTEAVSPGGWSASRGSGPRAFPALPGTEQLRGWISVHVHGALTSGHDDGWAHNVLALGDTARTRYPNRQSARTMWYHDHAMAVTRFNVYAGLAGFWLIRDRNERSLGLPDGEREIPLMIGDRNLETSPAGRGPGGLTGRMLYKQAGFTFTPGGQPGEVPIVGPYSLVNGRIWPFVDVEPRWHRLRLLNASNSRVLRLALHDPRRDPARTEGSRDAQWASSDAQVRAARKAASRLSGRLVVIGADAGLLPAPHRPFGDTVVLGPGERLDVLVDLRGLDETPVELRNEDGVLHAVPGDAEASILQLRVGRARGRGRETWEPPAVLDRSFRRYEHLEGGRLRAGHEIVEHHEHLWVGIIPPGPAGGVHPEMWELAEIPAGETLPERELIQVVEHGGAVRSLRPVAKLFDDATTIRLNRGDWAVWHFLHLGGPAHPMHIHMADFQAIGRRRIDPASWDPVRARTTAPLVGRPVPPEEFDDLVRAPKDTWTMNAGEWLSVAGHFEGASGSFMYHCHILDHEDHTMMRPFTVLPQDIITFHAGHGSSGHDGGHHPH